MPHQSPFALPAGWSARTLTTLRRNLLTWFDAHQRPLLWRADRDPYRIWVSEVMLQQTTVAAVTRYFDRFLTRFPTLEALAKADEQDVLREWEGLGYYRRARHLHAAARILAASHPEGLPNDPDVWAELPGVGRYILGAVLSQAFDRKLPIVEANSLRVFARLLGFTGDPRQGAGQRWVWSAAEALLPGQRVGDFNQALMELGAVVCTPTSPGCGECPVRSACVARREGLQESIPPKKVQAGITQVHEVGVVIWDHAKVLLCRRPASARWANLWEVPHGERLPGEVISAGARRVAKELTNLAINVGEVLQTIRHGVTRWSIEMVCVEAQKRSGRFASSFYSEGRWVNVADLGEYPVSSPQRKLLGSLSAKQE